VSEPQPTLNTAPPSEGPTPSHRKRALLAAVLSFLFSGMGQLYSRQPRKTVFFAVVTHLFGQLSAHTRLLFDFRSMVVLFLTQLIWKVLVIVDAARSANKRSESPIAFPRLTYPVLVVVVIVGNVFPAITTLNEKSGFAAFKVPSRSMCPAICVGDRIVVDTNAYRSRDPLRGDVIAMKHPSSEGPFLKRIIGLPGDTLAPGPDATVLVNGQPFFRPMPCAMPSWSKVEPFDYSEFHPTKVLEGTYFVIGDNVRDSFDSRVVQFGPVTRQMILGKPLYFYWSPTHSRIGCAIR
jgi:signal peptidase I